MVAMVAMGGTLAFGMTFASSTHESWLASMRSRNQFDWGERNGASDFAENVAPEVLRPLNKFSVVFSLENSLLFVKYHTCRHRVNA